MSKPPTPPPEPAPSPSGAPEFSVPTRLLLGVLFAALVCLRLPNVIWRGRFYAEEGAFFFAYAWHMPWERALWHPLGGYLNIVASGSTLLAKVLVERSWLPLEDAPYVTEAIALFFQTCPAILILSSRASWLRPRWAVVAALAILATPPLAEQVWLHTLHSQFHLAICAALILTTETGGALGLTLFRLALLLLGPLSGPASIVMLPFFAARSLVERSRGRWLQTAILAFGSAVQLGLFYSASGARSYHIDADVLAGVMFVRHAMLPLLGPVLTIPLAHDIRVLAGAGGMPWGIPLASALLFGGLALAALYRWREAAAWLLIPGLALAAVSYTGAIRAGPSLLTVEFATRYAFAPQVLIGFALLALATSHRGRLSQICAIAVAWIVAIGLLSYFRPLDSVADGPDWRAEVAAWRADPQHRLAVWPKGWLADLAPTDARCSRDPHAVDPPDFCDQYWEKL
jgi:hypothetical protein